MRNKLFHWIDSLLSSSIPGKAEAFCFNLYEESDGIWGMELIGAGYFDQDDDDWACDEVTDFGSRENMFRWRMDGGWEEVHRSMAVVLREYLCKGKHADVLKASAGVGVGFVDGDLEILYTKKDSP